MRRAAAYVIVAAAAGLLIEGRDGSIWRAPFTGAAALAIAAAVAWAAGELGQETRPQLPAKAANLATT